MQKTYSSEKTATAAAKKALGVTAVKHVDFTVKPVAGGDYIWEKKSSVEVDHKPANKLIGELLEPVAETVVVAPEAETLPAEVIVEPVVTGGFAALVAQVTSAPQPTTKKEKQVKPAPVTTGRKIEKVREERNGVKKPSSGGKCRAVWDALDALVAEGKPATAKAIREHATAQGWNVNNASIEFYQWNKFNGTTPVKG